MITFEKHIIPAASMGDLNPMPDIKNVTYIHAGYEMTDKVKEEEKTHIGKGMIPTMLPYLTQDGYDRNNFYFLHKFQNQLNEGVLNRYKINKKGREI